MPQVIIKTKKRAPANLVPRGEYDGTNSITYMDAWKKRRLPRPEILAREYKGPVYTCANLNAYGCSIIPLKLYMKTDSKSEKSILRQGIELKKVSHNKKEYLSSVPHLQKTLRNALDIEEVVEHPILDLLETANTSTYLNGERLFVVGQLYQEILGEEYWKIDFHPVFKIPVNIWLLPSQFVVPVKLEDNATARDKLIDHYLWCPPNVPPKKFQPKDIVQFLMPSLINPYVEGISPLEAEYESNEVQQKEMSFQNALLSNEGRPDFIVSPKDADSAMGPGEAKRFERQLRLRFTKGKSGGMYVAEDPISLLPITLPVRDLGRWEISKSAIARLASAFDVPYGFISQERGNRQQQDADEIHHAKHGIKPRLNRRACVLNERLIPFYDPSGRLFLAYDDPVPVSKDEKLQENIQLGMNGFKAPNEVREEYGLPPKDGGDELRPINVSPDIMRQNKREDGSDKVNDTNST